MHKNDWNVHFLIEEWNFPKYNFRMFKEILEWVPSPNIAQGHVTHHVILET